jgi:nucleoside 2-deoxyribosyltransferase
VKVYLICPVRNCPAEVLASISEYVKEQELFGHKIHWPHRDVSQSDPTGSAICATHLAAMRNADEVHVIWDVESKGSHFDLGMAYALNKRVVAVKTVRPDTDGKSYWKVMCALG